MVLNLLLQLLLLPLLPLLAELLLRKKHRSM